MILLFLGASGCGKDTQADLLVERYQFKKIASGDIFRNFPRENPDDPLTSEVQTLIQKGVFPKVEITYTLFKRYFQNHPEIIQSSNLILSGFVRLGEQIPHFDTLLEDFKLNLDYAVLFDLNEAVAVERLSLRRVCPQCNKNYHLKFLPPKNDQVCDLDGAKLYQRDDDYPEAIKLRHQQFYTEIKQITDHYQKQGKLLTIDANPSIAAIFTELEKKLGLTK